MWNRIIVFINIGLGVLIDKLFELNCWEFTLGILSLIEIIGLLFVLG